MNGQLSEQPLAELIREIAAKSVGGRLQLQHERLRAVIYFDRGELLYAASNLKQLRLREYLLKAGIDEAALARYDERQPDLELAKTLTRDHLLSPATAEQIQTRQASDVLRLALSWTEGVWEFDRKARLSETLNFKLDARPLILEAGRRMPAKFAASRFRVPSELISPGTAPNNSDNLLPTEVFLLSRLDRPTPLNELIAVSGLSENETLVLVYSLTVGGLLQREHWKSAFSGQKGEIEPEPEKPTAPEPLPEEQPADDEVDIESFLARINNAQTHYEVLDVSNEASPSHMKSKYYDLARRYHPDRFRKEDASLVARMESAFARITQAYDTLRDDGLRASYDSRLRARQKAQQLADTAPKPAVSPVTSTPTRLTTSVKDAAASLVERAEKQFKEGFAALELGDRKAALGLFASAATAVPNEPRYRAFYGQLLAEQEHTRRAAETELQAAVKLDPKNGEYRAILAVLYRDLGLMLRARGEAERALEADPNNRKARDLLRALKSV